MTGSSSINWSPKRHAKGVALMLLTLLFIGILALANWLHLARTTQQDGPRWSSSFYAKFQESLPSGEDFFPIGVFMEKVLEEPDVKKDKQLGLNTYVNVVAGSNLALARQEGMFVIAEHQHVNHQEDDVSGWFLADEADMWAGPGESRWTGKWPGAGEICDPPASKCGFSVMDDVKRLLPHDGRLRFANYGKGVLFWVSDEAASRFVNTFQDVVSADVYWYTDLAACEPYEGGRLFERSARPMKCPRAANYGATVRRMHQLVDSPDSTAVWAFIEVGHPSGHSEWPTIKPAQIRAAVWHSLINEARGIVYFNHSFSGPCETQHALREPCYSDVRATVADVNAQMSRLARVLNASNLENIVEVEGEADVAVRSVDEDLYILAGSTGDGTQSVTFLAQCREGAAVDVIDENRTLTFSDGGFSDTFVGETAVHLYKVSHGAVLCAG